MYDRLPPYPPVEAIPNISLPTFYPWNNFSTEELVGGESGAAAYAANIELLRKFIRKIPYPVTITSAFRSPGHNAEVGGTGTSQHMNGLAVDMVPTLKGMDNRMLATWFYKFRHFFPELDQVIWYPGTSHVHVGICPPGATGCVSGTPRGQFFQSPDTRSTGLSPWAPSSLDLASKVLGKRPVWSTIALTSFLVSTGVSVIGLALMYRYQNEIKAYLDR